MVRKKLRPCRLLGTLAPFLIMMALGACQNPTMENIRVQTTYRIRIYPTPQHGTLAVSAERTSGNSVVEVYANPDPGYVLDEDKLLSLSEVSGANPSKIPRKSACYALDITNYNVSITAAFVSKPQSVNPAEQVYTVSIDRSLSNGKIYSYPLYGKSGDEIRLFLLPDSGYDLELGSLMFDDGTPIDENVPYTFTMPTRDVTVKARFVAQDYSGLLAAGDKYLNVGEYDTAASFYREAYKKNPNDPKTIMYSTFVELGDLLLDPDVRSMLGTLGMGVPSTLNDWMCDKDYIGNRWYTTYPGVHYDTAAEGKNPPEYVHTTYSTEDITLPSLSLRGNDFVTPFGDFNISQATATTQKFFNILFWCLIYNNRSGLNSFLDRVEQYVFGDTFEAIAARAASFPPEAKVLLNERLKERFDLNELYGPGPTEIGAAELNFIFGNLRAVKAFFEYLSAYDWTIDLRPWLTTEIYVDDGLDQILNKIFKQAYSNEKHKAYWTDPPTFEPILPFRNSFLRVRNAGKMSQAKADMSQALSMMNQSMNTWYGGGSNFTVEAKANHQWAKGAVAAAKTALDNNGVFYFPKKMPKSEAGATWPDRGTADYGLNVAQFFTPGAFTLQNLFTTELGGRAPSFFRIQWYEYAIGGDWGNGASAYFYDFEKYELVTGSEPTGRDAIEQDVDSTGNAAPYRIYSLEMNTAYLKQLFPKGFEQYGDRALMCKVFPTIPLWPTRPTYFRSNGDARELSEARLYYFYHWR